MIQVNYFCVVFYTLKPTEVARAEARLTQTHLSSLVNSQLGMFVRDARQLYPEITFSVPANVVKTKQRKIT